MRVLYAGEKEWKSRNNLDMKKFTYRKNYIVNKIMTGTEVKLK
jgi:hypothetical protein